METLRLHDAQKGTSYVETLEAYFTCLRIRAVGGEAMFVHPNTFRYRLRRLTEISGLDLDDPLERLVAELQLRIFDSTECADQHRSTTIPATARVRVADRARSRQFSGAHKVARPTAER